MLDNYSSVTEFYLLGFPGSKELHNILFATFFFFYSVTLIGNMVIILTVCADKRLQSPTYFFLGHLSVLEILTTSVAVPLMLWGLLLPGMQAVSLSACCVQLYLYLSLGTSELLLQERWLWTVTWLSVTLWDTPSLWTATPVSGW